jgi:putative membrane protein
MMYWNNGGGWGMALTMIFGNLLFWGLIVTGIVLLVRSLGRPGPTVAPDTAARPTPQAVLAERYARGEIDDDDYAHRMKVLSGTG